MLIERTSNSEQDTINLATALGAQLQPGDAVLLQGELGAGKTQFVKGLALGLGHTDQSVASPTYVLMHHHETIGRTPLLHIDAYRMGEHDADTLGLDAAEVLRSVIAVEWPERMNHDWPNTTIRITLEHAGEHQRHIIIEYPEALSSRIPPLQESQ